VSATEPNRLMLFGEIIVLHCETVTYKCAGQNVSVLNMLGDIITSVDLVLLRSIVQAMLMAVAAGGTAPQHAASGARTVTGGCREVTQPGLEAATHGAAPLPHQVLQVRRRTS
jgi:hypothetical protein